MTALRIALSIVLFAVLAAGHPEPMHGPENAPETLSPPGPVHQHHHHHEHHGKGGYFFHELLDFMKQHGRLGTKKGSGVGRLKPKHRADLVKRLSKSLKRKRQSMSMADLKERFKTLKHFLGPFLPDNIQAVERYQKMVANKLPTKANKEFLLPAVRRFSDAIYANGVMRMYFEQMIEQVPTEVRFIDSIDKMIQAINFVVMRPVFFAQNTARVNFPVTAILGFMMLTDAGVNAFRFTPINEGLRAILKDWCKFLDSPYSVYVINKKDGWLSPIAKERLKLDQYLIDWDAPYGGFKSFNEFFHRPIDLSLRPVGKGVVSSNDGAIWNIVHDAKKQTQFWVKGEEYSLTDMLNHSIYTDRFVGGTVFQSILSGNDYHRWHAPVKGIIRELIVMEGEMYNPNSAFAPDDSGKVDIWLVDDGFETSVNTRGIVIFESIKPKIGMVAMIPTGLVEVSSIRYSEGIKVGAVVEKGQEIGHFSFGGSTLALVFEANRVELMKEEGEYIKCRSQIAKVL